MGQQILLAYCYYIKYYKFGNLQKDTLNGLLSVYRSLIMIESLFEDIILFLSTDPVQ